MDKKALEAFVESRLEGTDYFLVEASIGAGDMVKVEIDSARPVDVDFCVELSRAIEEAFPRDDEDYELEVGSAGLTAPFKIRRQYEINVGHEVEVDTTDNRRLLGTLMAVGDDSVTLRVRQKVRHEGAKRPVLEQLDIELPFSQIRCANCVISF